MRRSSWWMAERVSAISCRVSRAQPRGSRAASAAHCSWCCCTQCRCCRLHSSQRTKQSGRVSSDDVRMLSVVRSRRVRARRCRCSCSASWPLRAPSPVMGNEAKAARCNVCVRCVASESSKAGSSLCDSCSKASSSFVVSRVSLFTYVSLCSAVATRRLGRRSCSSGVVHGAVGAASSRISTHSRRWCDRCGIARANVHMQQRRRVHALAPQVVDAALGLSTWTVGRVREARPVVGGRMQLTPHVQCILPAPERTRVVVVVASERRLSEASGPTVSASR